MTRETRMKVKAMFSPECDEIPHQTRLTASTQRHAGRLQAAAFSSIADHLRAPRSVAIFSHTAGFRLRQLSRRTRTYGDCCDSRELQASAMRGSNIQLLKIFQTCRDALQRVSRVIVLDEAVRHAGQL